MRYVVKRDAKSQAGVTLLELVIGLAIAALLVVPIAGITNQLIFLPGQWSASITVMNDARAAVRSVADDTRQAAAFTTSTEPYYGTFVWNDWIGYPTSSYEVRYFHSTSTGEGALMREETLNGVAWTTLVAEGIREYDDVSIQGSNGLVTASVTSTRESIVEDIVQTSTIKALMRPVLPTPYPTPPPLRLAWDDFETDDFTGGSGWLDDWYDSGDASVVSTQGPYEGSFHLRLRRANGYVDRALDLSGWTNVRLQFWAKADSFEPGEFAQLLVSPDGAVFTPVRTWVDGEDDDMYRFEDIDLSSFSMTDEFWIAFDAEMSGTGDLFFVDDLKVVSTWTP